MKSSALTVTDQFCGAGGSSLGAQIAGAEVVLALNHWKLAVESHHTNFPNTLHDCTDISACDPRRYPSTNLLMTSPECTNHTIAKGRKRTLKQPGLPGFGELLPLDPAEDRSRATMFDVPRFAEYHDYELIIVENVVEARKWVLFDSWLSMMQKLDYHWEIVYFNSMFAPPTPQSRDRMYVVFWKKGNPAPDLRFTPAAYCGSCEKAVAAVQSWKNPRLKWGRYGHHRQYVYRCPACAGEVVPSYAAAATAIDWSLPIGKIGDRKKALADKTLRRIAFGLQKFRQDLATQTAENDLALVSPFLVSLSHGSDTERAVRVGSPMPTQTTRQDQALVIASQEEKYDSGNGRPVTAQDHHPGLAFSSPFLLDHLGEYRPRAISGPCSTVCAAGNHHSLVVPPAWSWLLTYYNHGQLLPLQQATPTVTTLPRHALVTARELADHVHVEDCSFRMLHPSEIGRAMAFPDSYVVLGSQRQKTKQYGNAVTPPVMSMLVERCLATLK